MAHLDQKRLAVVGCGNLGRALVAGLIESGAMSPDRIAVSNRRSERSRAMAERFQVRAADDNVDCVSGADVVLVAVKPQIVPGVLEELAGPAQDALVISVAAGVSSGRIESELERNPRVVRAMPNT
ncbi:MAG: NAD(P)-binding domain-containing protein, partial [Myxococcota bacterium]